MAESYIKLDLDTSMLRRLGEQMERELSRPGGGPQPIADALRQVGAIYMGFTRERFDKFSRGGGDWAPLSASTLARKQRKGRTASGNRTKRQRVSLAILEARGALNAGETAILRDTGLLFGSLTQFGSEPIPGGVRVGSQLDYAKCHQEGTDTIPARPIFAQPDAPTLDQMPQSLERGLQRSIDQFRPSFAG